MNAFEVMFWVGLVLLCGWLGERNGIRKSAEEINALQKRVEYCETGWRLDAELFFPNLCKTVCVEEFEKMGC